MILTDLEKQLHELESPYAIAINKIKIIKEELNGDFDDMLKQVGDIKRVSAIAQLLASDYTSDKKLFTEKEELEGLGNEIKVGDKVFSSPYLFKEIPTDTILYYSRYSTYEKAPETKLQLYNDIIRFARKDLKEDFLRKMLTSDDLDINLIFGSDVHGHLEENHVNTEREKVSRVLLEQKPGTSIVTIEIPTPEEYEKQTGKVFDEDEYYEFLNDLFEDANEKINDDKIAQYIRDAIKENIDEIMFWFSSSDHELFEKKGADANEISIKYDIRKSSIYEGTEEDPEYIGSGYDLTLREKFTPIIKIPIRKDKFSPLGINAKTLYPYLR